MAAIASGTTIEAPRPVIVPETLMTGRSPREGRMSSDMKISGLCWPIFCPQICVIDSYAIVM
jgi:hypothetical protein